MEELKTVGKIGTALEDNAPAHCSNIDIRIFKVSDVVKLLWPPNLPNANAIEPAWPWFGLHITQDNPPYMTAEGCEKQWK